MILRFIAVAASLFPLLLFGQPRSKYIGQVLTQRTFYSGSKLRYDQQGRLLDPASQCSWTLCAKIRIKDVQADGANLKISGERQLLAFPKSAPRQGIDVFSDPKWRFVSKQQEDQLRSQRPVEIDVEGVGPWDDAAIDKAMARVFLTPSENIVDHVPDFWTSYLCNPMVPSARCAEDPLVASTQKVGHGVSAPSALTTPDPTYSEAARFAAYQGTTVLWIIVTPDGHASDIKIAHAIGLGLDDKAVESVSSWTFRPGLRNRQPVPVQINVEVNFRLY